MSDAESGFRRRVFEIAAEALECESVRGSENFFERGGDSMTIVRFCDGVEQSLGVPVPLDLAWDSPDFASLAEAVERRAESARTSS